MAQVGHFAPSDQEQQACRPGIGALASSAGELTATLCTAFSALTFHNRFTLHPREFPAYARELTERLLEYCSSFDSEVPAAVGRKMGGIGFGHATILAASNAIRQFCVEILSGQDSQSPLTPLELADGFVSPLLIGYMQQREQWLLDEQKRLRSAYTQVHGPGGG
jgi:hypothetical protein